MLTRSASRRLLAAIAVTAATWATVPAGEPLEVHRTEVGVQAGFFLPDQDVSNKDDDLQELEPLGGLRFGFVVSRRLDWFVDADVADVNTDTLIADVETRTARTGVAFYFRPAGKKVRWFVAGGGGLVDYDLEFGPDFDRVFASLGVGQRVQLDRRANFRWELRADQAFDDSDIFDGQDITRASFMIGVNWGLGRNPRDSDSDGDGVGDRDDECPDTPSCAIVDERGCPKDSDGDGVWDGCDRCPDTPSCAIVDEEGCPKDSDGDGVWDGCDRCPDTPSCAIVDEEGCPKDSDGDGVWDGCDLCPDTPEGTPVRPDGCPKAEPLFPERTKTLILEGVFFEFDRAVLRPESRETLDRVLRSLIDWPGVRLEVGGHTDWVGTAAYNQDLSQRRAAAVVEYLVSRGIDPSRLRARGYGEAEPIADNESEGGRARNRRVELKRLD